MRKLALNSLDLDESNKLWGEERKAIQGGGCPLICYDCLEGYFCFDSCIEHPYPCSS